MYLLETYLVGTHPLDTSHLCCVFPELRIARTNITADTIDRLVEMAASNGSPHPLVYDKVSHYRACRTTVAD